MMRTTELVGETSRCKKQWRNIQRNDIIVVFDNFVYESTRCYP